MKPGPLKRLTATQTARLTELELISSRIREKPRSALNANIIQARLDSINEIWTEARKAHIEIISRDEADADQYVTYGVFTSLQTTYEDTTDYLLILAAEFEKEKEATSRASVSGNAHSSISRAAKLPKLDLPTFSGKYEDWESFSDLFAAFVHNAPGLDDATKLQYLKSCLTGSAADLVKDVTTTNANYTSTWQALRARFYNPRLTVANHLNALMNLPYLKRESAAEMRAFTDESQRIVRALTTLKMPVEHWDVWLVHILGARLDPVSRKLWESELSVKERAIIVNASSDGTDSELVPRFPTFAELAVFLEKRAHALCMINADNKSEKRVTPVNKPMLGARKIFHSSAARSIRGSGQKCPLCSARHVLARCPLFTQKNPYERRLDIRHLRLCFNCFGRHNYRDCTSNGRCAKCRDRHHTLLHFENKARVQDSSVSSEQSRRMEKGGDGNSRGINAHTLSLSAEKYSVILATAQVILVGPNGTYTRARALLDQGSEGSFIKEATAQLLGLARHRVRVPLCGIGGDAGEIAKSKTSFTVRSRFDPHFNIDTEALVLPRLTSKLPSRNLRSPDLQQFDDIKLADPIFYISESVDIILGADVYGSLLRAGLKTFPPSRLVAQNTILGWIVSGVIANIPPRRAERTSNECRKALHSAPAEEDLCESLRRFWDLEEIPQINLTHKPDEELCERIFSETHTRAPDGRFVIRLPIKGDLPAVGAETQQNGTEFFKIYASSFSKGSFVSNRLYRFYE